MIVWLCGTTTAARAAGRRGPHTQHEMTVQSVKQTEDSTYQLQIYIQQSRCAWQCGW